MNLLLTSCGLETEMIKGQFLKMISKNPVEIKAVFVPTAAIDPDAIGVLPKCMDDLLKCGIKKENIFVYDLHKQMPYSELKKYDVIYLCGGNPQYLLERINECGFGEQMSEFLEDGGAILGVSAGSIVWANNLQNNLGVLPGILKVHCGDLDCEKAGKYMLSKECIRLGNRQAIVFEQDNLRIVE